MRPNISYLLGFSGDQKSHLNVKKPPFFRKKNINLLTFVGLSGKVAHNKVAEWDIDHAEINRRIRTHT
jgi:hypothetical protein